MASNTGPLLTLHNPGAARRYYEAGLWRHETFCDLLEKHASERPNDFAIRDSARRLTWSELQEMVERISGHLAAAGVGLGDRIGLRLSNRVEGVAALLAASRIGCVANPSLHHNYTADEVVSLVTALSARVILTEDGVGVDAAIADFPAIAATTPGVLKVFTLPAGRVSAGALDQPIAVPPKQDDPDGVCYLAFTSGTTGKPKGVMHSANTLLANARDMVRDWGHDERTVLLSLSPLTHHIAWVATSQVLACGGELVLNDPPSGMAPLDWLLESQATYVMGVPTHAMDILADQKSRGLERLGSVKTFYMAGAPIPPAVAEGFRAQGVLPQNVYGMTENSSHQYTLPNDPDAVIISSCGRGGPAYQVRIVDQDYPDKDVAPGEIGQIAGQGACLMLGYFGNQEATENSFNKAGQFLSGDLGRLDSGGNLVVAGRLKDIVIRGGHNIHPTRIEDIAVAHPAIAKAAAFPAPDERLGERVCLAIILAESVAAPSADEVLRHLDAGGLSRYDMPEYFIVMDAFPLTASGKILKRKLSADLAQGKFAPESCRFTA